MYNPLNFETPHFNPLKIFLKCIRLPPLNLGNPFMLHPLKDLDVLDYDEANKYTSICQFDFIYMTQLAKITYSTFFV